MTMAAAHANPPAICRNTQEWTTKVSDISPLPLRHKSTVNFCVKIITWMNRRAYTMTGYRSAGSIAISTTLDLRIGIMFMAKARSKITLIMLSISSLSFVMLTKIPSVHKRINWWKIQRKLWVRSSSSILYSCKGNHVLLESSVGETVIFNWSFQLEQLKPLLID